MRRTIPLAALLLMLAAAPMARAADPADIAFWTSVSNSTDPAEFRAYLHAFPHGQFAGLAQVKLDELKYPASAPANVPPPQRPASNLPAASVEPTRSVWRAIDRIELDVDASNLGFGSNQRLVIVPANTPDTIADPNAFARISLPIAAEILHMTLPPGPVGNDQIRLVYIPQFGNRFVVAARAAIRVLPSSPGAIIAGALTNEARLAGSVGFDAKYRDRMVKVEGQFLRTEARTTFAGWDATGEFKAPEKYVELYLGALGTPADAEGDPWEVLCMLPVAGGALARIAALHAGDDVVITGTASTWDSFFGERAVLIDRCEIVR